MRYVTFFTILLYLAINSNLGLSSETDKGTNKSGIEAEEYAVYSVVLHEGQRIFGETEDIFPSSLFAYDLKALPNQIQSESIVHDYVEKNQKKYLLNNKFIDKVTFVTRDEYNKDTRNPVTSVSRVGFNTEKDKALVHLTRVCSPACADDSYYYLVKENGAWKIDKPIRFRIWN